MGSNGSFYQNGLPLSTLETGLGNVPASVTPKTANSSFYLSGSIYNTLSNQDALLALLTADTALVVADLVSANAAAAAAAASAAAATTTLASSLLKANNLSDLASVAAAKVNLGLDQVSNTSDANKPVSTAQATADALVASNAATATALKANISSPAFTGVPTTAATPAALDNSLKLATTAYADLAVGVEKTRAQAAEALLAPLASPTLTGTPAAPTATAGTNTTQLATTAFVDAARVVLAASVALKAPLASPALTGTPTAPTAAALNNTTQLATTAYADAAVGVEKTRALAAEALLAPLASAALTGTPTAPTATVGTNTTQLATTAFVLANGASAGVASFATRTGAVVPATNDYTFAQIGTKPTTIAGYGITDGLTPATLGAQFPAWTVYSAGGFATTGTLTSSARYFQLGKLVFLQIVVTLTSACTGPITITLPVGSKSAIALPAKETAVTGLGGELYNASGTSGLLTQTSGASFTTNGSSISITGVYEAV